MPISTRSSPRSPCASTAALPSGRFHRLNKEHPTYGRAARRATVSDRQMKRIAILGSTGSIGVTTLDVVGRFPDQFRSSHWRRERTSNGWPSRSSDSGRAGGGRRSTDSRRLADGGCRTTVAGCCCGRQRTRQRSRPRRRRTWWYRRWSAPWDCCRRLRRSKRGRMSRSPTKRCWWWPASWSRVRRAPRA